MNIDPEVVSVGIPSFVQYDVAMEIARQADDREVGRGHIRFGQRRAARRADRRAVLRLCGHGGQCPLTLAAAQCKTTCQTIN